MVSRIADAAFAGLLLVIGVWLMAAGGQLATLGGSWYYVLAGAGLVAVSVLVALRRPQAGMLYAALVAATLVWSVMEAGLDMLALLPRIAAWLVLGLWFLAPWRPLDTRKGAMPLLASLAAGVALLGAASVQGYRVEAAEAARTSDLAPASMDWAHYGADAGGSKFSRLDQINLQTVSGLKEVWRARTGVENDFKNTPLAVDGRVFVCTAGNVLIALDGDTGAEIWRHDTGTVTPGNSTFARTCRGLGHHDDKTASAAGGEEERPCRRRILTNTVDARLIAVDAATGQRCAGFGVDGVVDLRAGLGPHPPHAYFVTSPPLVAGDVVVVGGWVVDSQQLGNPSGVLRAYDVRTGAFVWAWDLGRPGYNGFPAEGEEFTRGTPNVWSITSHDPELGLVFAPTGNASPDYFAGELRSPETDAYSSSVVALDVATGQPRWSFQTVHRDVWDYDVPSQPTLVDIRKDGEIVPALVQATKRGEVFVLDRRTGKPVWPVEERPVPQGGVEGERLSPTQPFSSTPNFRPDRLEQDMWGLTPLDQLHCRIQYRKLRYEGHFTPVMGKSGRWEGTFQFPGNAGGFNWGGVSVDADNGLLVAAPMLMGNRIVQRTKEEQAQAMAERAARQARMSGETGKPPEQIGPPAPQAPADPRFDPARIPYRAATEPFMSTWRIPFTPFATEIPCFEPPWSRIAVIDLKTNRLLWSRPMGSMRHAGPFGLKSGIDVMVGTPLQGGPMTTRGGLVFHGGAMDATLRAFDIRSGKVVWKTDLPANAHATPMTYASPSSGRQYVVITVPDPSWTYPRQPPGSVQGRDGKGGYVIAYALDPAPGAPPTAN